MGWPYGQGGERTMLRKIINLAPILAAALLVLPMKASAFDWNQEGSPGTVQALPGHPGMGVACDSDGDDCHTVRLPGYGGGYGYSQPYAYQQPSYGYGYGSAGKSLLDQRASAMAQF